MRENKNARKTVPNPHKELPYIYLLILFIHTFPFTQYGTRLLTVQLMAVEIWLENIIFIDCNNENGG